MEDQRAVLGGVDGTAHDHGPGRAERDEPGADVAAEGGAPHPVVVQDLAPGLRTSLVDLPQDVGEQCASAGRGVPPLD